MGRAIAEVAIIVTGILLAFGVDAGWNWRQDRAREREHLEAIRVELEIGLTLLPRSAEVSAGILHA